MVVEVWGDDVGEVGWGVFEWPAGRLYIVLVQFPHMMQPLLEPKRAVNQFAHLILLAQPVLTQYLPHKKLQLNTVRIQVGEHAHKAVHHGL